MTYCNHLECCPECHGAVQNLDRLRLNGAKANTALIERIAELEGMLQTAWNMTGAEFAEAIDQELGELHE